MLAGSTRIVAAAAACAAVAIGGSPAATADPGAIRDKQAEARRVLSELRVLDEKLNRAVEAYNGATVRLAGIREALTVNRSELAVARANLRIAQKRLATQVVALYVTGEVPEQSTLEVLLGSRSMGEVIDRIDTAKRVSALEARVLVQVKAFRRSVVRRERRLEQAHALQMKVVAERAARRNEIGDQLAERNRLLDSVRGEIAKLQAQERARQAELERQARARLSAQEAATRRAVENTVVGVTAEAPVGADGVTVTVAPPSQYGGVVGIAMQYLGVPYVWGGASPSGFDCSGLTMYVYAQVGVSLPHYTGSQWQLGTPVSRAQLEPGDLVFFHGLSHEGIYIGNDQFIHAPHTGDVVKISSMSDAWYASGFDGGRRL